MKRLFVILLIVFAAPLSNAEKGHAEQAMPESIQSAGGKLVLNGRGDRTKFFLTLYEAGLYLQNKSSDAAKIIVEDQPMAMRLVIESSLITSEKMERATIEGFEKATRGNTAPIKNEIEEFISVFREEIKENDIYDMIYFPGTGIKVMKNNQMTKIIPGLPFKQALFGIWLSPDPVQESLKKSLLEENH